MILEVVMVGTLFLCGVHHFDYTSKNCSRVKVENYSINNYFDTITLHQVFCKTQ